MSSIGDDYYWRKLTIADYEEVICLIHQYYSPEGPLQVILNLESKDVEPVDELRVRQKLLKNVSIGIFDKKLDKLVAATLNEISEESQSQPSDDEHISENFPQAYMPITRLVEFVSNNLPRKFQESKFLDPGMITVHGDYRRKGLATELVKLCDQVAVDSGCKCIVVMSYSAYTQQILNKSGYKTVQEMRLSDYIDEETGLHLFSKPFPPHTLGKVQYKLLLN